MGIEKDHDSESNHYRGLSSCLFLFRRSTLFGVWVRFVSGDKER